MLKTEDVKSFDSMTSNGHLNASLEKFYQHVQDFKAAEAASKKTPGEGADYDADTEAPSAHAGVHLNLEQLFVGEGHLQMVQNWALRLMHYGRVQARFQQDKQ